PQIVEAYLKMGKYVILCTNALLLEKKIDQYKPHKNFCWDIHLDGDKQMHDKSVDQDGVYERAIDAIKLSKSKGFRTSINCTLFEGADPDRVATFFDMIADMDIEGVMTSPGYAYERAPDQEHFLNRTRTKELFRAIFKRGEESKKRGKHWKFTQSPLFLDFLAGNQTYACTPWGNPTRNVFGWQRPCYLLGEGYAKTYKELIETTDWDKYGVGNYEKCADCMVHSGFEATAVMDSVKKPWKVAALALKGIKTDGAMAKDIPLDKARKAEYVFSTHVEKKMAEIHAKKAEAQAIAAE
ncbi:MAG: hopanoid biosynthesis associated radical SAM protein HpnH, partial [Acidocella sp. 35-58-6]